MNESIRRSAPLFGLLAALSASAALSAGTGTVAGKVIAPPGHDVNGTMIVACRMKPTPAPPSAPAAQPAPQARQPAANSGSRGAASGPVVGAFYNDRIRQGGYFDGKSRKWKIDSANDIDGYYVRFLPNGRYEFSSLFRTRVGFNTACYMRLYTYHSGRAQWGNGQVTLTPEFKIGRRENECSPESNENFTPTFGAQTWTVASTTEGASRRSSSRIRTI